MLFRSLTLQTLDQIGVDCSQHQQRDRALEIARAQFTSGQYAARQQTYVDAAIDRFLASIYPSTVPILSLEGTGGQSDDRRVVDRAEGSWPAALDRLGSGWVPVGGPPPLE